jgi:hypothetical protein
LGGKEPESSCVGTYNHYHLAQHNTKIMPLNFSSI